MCLLQSNHQDWSLEREPERKFNGAPIGAPLVIHSTYEKEEEQFPGQLDNRPREGLNSAFRAGSGNFLIAEPDHSSQNFVGVLTQQR